MGYFLFPPQASFFFLKGKKNAKIVCSGTGVFQAIKRTGRAKRQESSAGAADHEAHGINAAQIPLLLT